MTASLRALRALALLAGFCLMGVALLAVLIAADWVLLTRPFVTQSVHLVLSVVVATGALAVPILRGMFAFRGSPTRWPSSPPPGGLHGRLRTTRTRRRPNEWR
ncbi:hypothetical protein [Streptomyces sp. NPDC005181]|uniref:hypothetical protein n=1 Tax=Streptomyces sp. NPDC005181 TaxID=3156869 RepID=UPI0033A913A8